MSALLEVREVSVAYGKVEAVHGVSLAIDAGSIVTVIGPNGAGKTTLLAAIMGLLPARGDDALRGRVPGRGRRRAARRTGTVPGARSGASCSPR